MRTKNRVLGLLLCLVMCVALVACGSKTPTAEDLIKNGMPGDKPVDVDILLDVEVAIGADAMGLDGVSGSMTIGMGIDANMKTDGDISHIEGKVFGSMFGMDYSERMNEWSVTEDGIVTTYSATYSKDSDVPVWTYTTSYEDSEGIAGLASLGVDVFTDLKVVKDGNEYQVTGKVDMAALEASGLSDVMGELASMGGDDVSDMDINVSLIFDAKTEMLKRMEMSVDTQAEGVTFNKFTLGFVINSIGDVKLTVPAEVLAAEPAYVYDYDWDSEDIDWDSEDIDWDFGGFGDDFDFNTDGDVDE